MRDTGKGQSGHGKLTPDHVKALSRVNLFARLDAAEVERLSTHFEPLRVQRGRAVCRCGDPGDYLYVIVSGSFAVLSCSPGSTEEVRIATRGPGDYFGEMALLTGKPRSATVMAEEKGELLRLRKTGFLELLKCYPSMEIAVIASLCDRLRAADRELVQMSRIAVSTISRTLGQLPPERRREALKAVDKTISATPVPENSSSVRSPANTLSPREREVASLVARGLTNSEIADKLIVSGRTAETHVNHILNKLGYSSRAQIAAWAVAQGLVTDLGR